MWRTCIYFIRAADISYFRRLWRDYVDLWRYWRIMLIYEDNEEMLIYEDNEDYEDYEDYLNHILNVRVIYED